MNEGKIFLKRIIRCIVFITAVLLRNGLPSQAAPRTKRVHVDQTVLMSDMNTNNRTNTYLFDKGTKNSYKFDAAKKSRKTKRTHNDVQKTDKLSSNTFYFDNQNTEDRSLNTIANLEATDNDTSLTSEARINAITHKAHNNRKNNKDIMSKNDKKDGNNAKETSEVDSKMDVRKLTNNKKSNGKKKKIKKRRKKSKKRYKICGRRKIEGCKFAPRYVIKHNPKKYVITRNPFLKYKLQAPHGSKHPSPKVKKKIIDELFNMGELSKKESSMSKGKENNQERLKNDPNKLTKIMQDNDEFTKAFGIAANRPKYQNKEDENNLNNKKNKGEKVNVKKNKDEETSSNDDEEKQNNEKNGDDKENSKSNKQKEDTKKAIMDDDKENPDMKKLVDYLDDTLKCQNWESIDPNTTSLCFKQYIMSEKPKTDCTYKNNSSEVNLDNISDDSETPQADKKNDLDEEDRESKKEIWESLSKFKMTIKHIRLKKKEIKNYSENQALKDLKIKLYLGDTEYFEGVPGQECYYLKKDGELNLYYLQRKEYANLVSLSSGYTSDKESFTPKCKFNNESVRQNDIYRIDISLQILKAVILLLEDCLVIEDISEKHFNFLDPFQIRITAITNFTMVCPKMLNSNPTDEDDIIGNNDIKHIIYLDKSELNLKAARKLKKWLTKKDNLFYNQRILDSNDEASSFYGFTKSKSALERLGNEIESETNGDPNFNMSHYLKNIMKIIKKIFNLDSLEKKNVSKNIFKKCVSSKLKKMLSKVEESNNSKDALNYLKSFKEHMKELYYAIIKKLNPKDKVLEDKLKNKKICSFKKINIGFIKFWNNVGWNKEYVKNYHNIKTYEQLDEEKTKFKQHCSSKKRSLKDILNEKTIIEEYLRDKVVDEEFTDKKGNFNDSLDKNYETKNDINEMSTTAAYNKDFNVQINLV